MMEETPAHGGNIDGYRASDINTPTPQPSIFETDEDVEVNGSPVSSCPNRARGFNPKESSR